TTLASQILTPDPGILESAVWRAFPSVRGNPRINQTLLEEEGSIPFLGKLTNFIHGVQVFAFFLVAAASCGIWPPSPTKLDHFQDCLSDRRAKRRRTNLSIL
ncbi:MAG: hypothetical protein ACKPKO_06745, partial [Candidatus Fonsibacter sp.]